MTQRKRSLIISAVLFAIASIVAYLPTQAAQTCNSVGNVSPRYNVANIRGISGNTTATPVSTLSKGTSVPVMQAQANGWFPLCVGGYVSGDVVVLVTNTATVTPTRTPVVTRIPSATPGASPTPNVSVWIVFGGVAYECELPCTFEVIDRP